MAIADDPGSSDVLGLAGCALADLGHHQRGAEILQQACEIDPSNAQSQVALGAALAMLGDSDQALAHMRHGIKLSPRDRRLGFWGWSLGLALLRANRAEEALEQARIAARRDPRLHLPLILEAVAQATLGRIVLARAALMSARRIRPKLTLREIEISHGRRAAGRTLGRQLSKPQHRRGATPLPRSSAKARLDVALGRLGRVPPTAAFSPPSVHSGLIVARPSTSGRYLREGDVRDEIENFRVNTGPPD